MKIPRNCLLNFGVLENNVKIDQYHSFVITRNIYISYYPLLERIYTRELNYRKNVKVIMTK